MLAFDVDNTLTPPREEAPPEICAALCALRDPFVLIAGSNYDLVLHQLLNPLRLAGFVGQVDTWAASGTERWTVTVASYATMQRRRSAFSLDEHVGGDPYPVWQALRAVIVADPPGVPLTDEMILTRIGSYNLCPIGRPFECGSKEIARRRQFIIFDRETHYRRRVLGTLRTAMEPFGLAVTLGGETSFDVTAPGHDKAGAVLALLDEGAGHVTFVGDALYADGNDAVVQWLADGDSRVTAIATHDWRETLEWLQQSGRLAA